MADYTLSASITAEAKGFTNTIDQAKAKMKGLSDDVKGFGSKITDVGKSMTNFGGKMTAFATTPIVAVSIGLIKAASDAEEMRGKFSVVFDGMESDMRSFAAESSQAWGRSQIDIEGYLGETQNMLVGMGMTRDAGADLSKEIVGLGIDLASFNNLAESDALNNMTSAISGNHEASKALGAVLNENTLATEMERMGLKGKFQDLDEGTKMQVRYNSILAQSADAVGDAERTSGSFANQMRNLKGTVKDVSAEFGDILLPIATELVSRITGVVETFRDFDEGLKRNIILGGLLVAAIGPVIMFMGIMGIAIGGVVTLFGILLSPVGLVIGALIGLGIAFGIAFARSEEFRNVVTNAFNTVKDTISGIVSTIIPILSGLFKGAVEGASGLADGLGGKLLGAFETIKSIVMTVADAVWQFVSSIMEGFSSAGGQVSSLSALLLGFNPFLKIAMMVLTQFGPQIAAGFSEIAALVVPVLTTVGTMLGQLAAAVIPIVMNVIGSLIPLIMELGGILAATLINLLPIVLDLFNNLVPIIMMVVEQIGAIIAVIVPLVANLVSALFPAIAMIAQTFLNIVSAVAPAFIAIIGAIGAAIQLLLPIISSIIQTIIHVVTNIITIITPIIGFFSMVIMTIIGIIAPIVTFVAGIMRSIFAAIRPIIEVVTGIFSIVMQVISSVWQGVMTFTGKIFTSIGTIISRLSAVVSGVFNTISGKVSSVMNNVSKTITGVFTAIRGAWSGLTTFVSSIFSGISGSVKTLSNQVKSFVNGVIGGINSAIGLINKIPGVSISKIPMLARGTDDWGGGFARMNEGGRGELVNLPGGSQVIPHDVSMRYAREAGKATSDRSVSAQQSSGQNNAELVGWMKKLYEKNQNIVLDTGAFVGGTYDEYDRHGGNKINLNGRRHR